MRCFWKGHHRRCWVLLVEVCKTDKYPLCDMPPPTCLVAGARLGRLACEITRLGTYTSVCINYFAHIISVAWNNTSIAGPRTWGFVPLVSATRMYTVSPSMCRFHHTKEGVFILHAHGAVEGCLAARSSPKHYSNFILPDRRAQNACSAKIPIHKVYGDSNNISSYQEELD